MSSIGNRGEAGAVFGDVVVYVQEVDPRRTSGKRPLHLKTWSTVKDVKQALQALLHVPMSKQRLFFHGQELGRRGSTDSRKGPLVSMRELKKYSHSLQDCGIVRDGETIYFAIAPSLQDDGRHRSFLRTYGLLSPPKRLVRSIKQVHRALELGINNPKLTVEGFGGTYFMYDPRKRPLACFKPADEEPYTPNNPRGRELVANWGLVGKESFAMRPGVKPGEGYIREVAAFVLDHGGFSGVPATTVVEAKHKAFHAQDGKETIKVGSFQEFVRHDAVVEDLSPSLFSRHEVQKIAVLDIRLLNSDRNGGNILVRRKQCSRRDGSFTPVGNGSSSRNHHHDYELIPIDHGYCLPEEVCIDDSLNLCWFEWRQVKEPMDKETVAFIESLDAERDAELLRQKLGIREAALDNLWLSTTLLKLAAAEKLTLYDVARIVVREASDTPSELEQVKETAEFLAQAVTRSSLHKSGKEMAKSARLRLLSGKDFVGVAAPRRPRSPRSGLAGDDADELLSRFTHTSSCSSMEDMSSLLSRDHSIASSSLHGDDTMTTMGSTGAADVSEAGGYGSAPLKIRLDVIEGTDFQCTVLRQAGDERFNISPASPVGFWHESLEQMNARASLAAAKAAGEMLLSGGAGGPGSSSSSSSGRSSSGGGGGDCTPLAHEDSVGSRCSDRSDPSTVGSLPGRQPFPGFFPDPELLEQAVRFDPYVIHSTTSCCLSDDDVENAPVNGSRGHSHGGGRQNADDGDDAYSWTFDMDVDNDPHAFEQAQPAVLANSSSGTSSASSSATPSPSSSPDANPVVVGRHHCHHHHHDNDDNITSNNNSSSNHSYQHPALASRTASSPPASVGRCLSAHNGDGGSASGSSSSMSKTTPHLVGPATAGSSSSSSNGSARGRSGRLVRALSSPDLKKHASVLKTKEGDASSRAGSSRFLRSRREDTRETGEYRSFYFHYAALLLRDLVKRRAKQKGLASM